MNIYEFNQLSSDKKAAFILGSCQFLIRRKVDAHLSVGLYHHCQERINTEFFIEVWYNATQFRIERYSSFTGCQQLEPYLEKVKLEGL